MRDVMKIGLTIVRSLLGLMFVVFGLNGFLHFIPQPPPPTGFAGQFLGALVGSHYMVPVFAIQVFAGVLFLVNRYVVLALTIIAPVIVNILLFHITMNPGGIAPGLVATVLWFIIAFHFRDAFKGLLRQTTAPSGN